MTPTAVLGLSLLAQVVLPGSNVGLEQAQAKSHTIVVARPARPHLILGSGPVSYTSLDLRHSAILKGKVNAEVLAQASISASGPETLPKPDEEYIFFINDYAQHLNILKALPSTAENRTAVKDEIKAGKKP